MSTASIPLSQGVGYGIIVGLGALFALGMIGISALLSKTGTSDDNEEFTVAKRSLKTGLTAAGVVSSWTWYVPGSPFRCSSLRVSLNSSMQVDYSTLFVCRRLSIWCRWFSLLCVSLSLIWPAFSIAPYFSPFSLTSAAHATRLKSWRTRI